jgi:hypothetical protein
MDMGRNIWLERARIVCWAGGEGFCLRDDLGIEIGGVDLGGVWGRIGTARPTSVCPRAFSTLGRLKRLNKDILEDTRSSFLEGFIDGVCDATDGDRAVSCRFAVDRLKRHREVVEEL